MIAFIAATCLFASAESTSFEENFWFHEGQTMGFRAIYMYVPSTNIIVAAAFNSSPDGANDHVHELLVGAYRLAVSR